MGKRQERQNALVELQVIVYVTVKYKTCRKFNFVLNKLKKKHIYRGIGQKEKNFTKLGCFLLKKQSSAKISFSKPLIRIKLPKKHE